MQNLTFEQLPSAIMELNRKMDTLLNYIPDKTIKKEDPLLTIEQLIDYLPEKPKRQTVYGWVNYRLIPYSKYGKRLYFRQSEIDFWLSNGRRVS